MKDGKGLLILSLAIVFIVFGALKVLGNSPVKDLVIAVMPFMSSAVAFGLLGIFEVLLGLGMLWQPARKYSALIMTLYLGSIIILTVLFALNRLIVNGSVSIEGEFVLKNLVLLAASYTVFVGESPIKWSKFKFKFQ